VCAAGALHERKAAESEDGRRKGGCEDQQNILEDVCSHYTPSIWVGVVNREGPDVKREQRRAKKREGDGNSLVVLKGKRSSTGNHRDQAGNI